VTDANLVLGRLDPNSFLGGVMQLDEMRTRDHLMRAKVTIPSIEAFAEGIVNLANAHMVQALRRISIDRGHDLRDFVLVSFGGAGPLHACALAQILRVPRVLIPAFPGALSAYGVLVSDFVRDYSRTVMKPVGHPSVERHFRNLERLAKHDMKSEGLKALSSRHVDMRYVGQGYELRLSWGNRLISRFHRLHSRRYGYADPNRYVEIVNLRVRMVASTKAIEPPRHRSFNGNGKGAIVAENLVIHNGRRLRAPVYQRSSLRAGDRFAGPAVVTEYSATTFVPPGCRAFVDKRLNLLIEV
jgi:N-methylhydantoinase A